MLNPRRGNQPYKWRDKFLSYDHTKPGLRDWWVKRALDMVGHDEIDGVFIDGLCKVNRGWLPVKRHGDAWLKTARQLREGLPEGKILIGNVIRAERFKEGNFKMLRYLDGSYLEGWYVEVFDGCLVRSR